MLNRVSIDINSKRSFESIFVSPKSEILTLMLPENELKKIINY